MFISDYSPIITWTKWIL